MKGKSGLTARQEKFIDEYMIDRNATGAAKRAGYAKGTSNSTSSKLLSTPAIRAEVNRRIEVESKKAGISAEFVLNGLKSFAEGKEPFSMKEPSVRVKAHELLGKHLKLFTEKVEVSGKISLEKLIEDSVAEDEA